MHFSDVFIASLTAIHDADSYSFDSNAVHAMPVVCISQILFLSYTAPGSLQMYWSQTQYLAPLHLSQLCAYDAVQSRSNRFAGLVDEHAGIIVEPHHASIWSLELLLGPHDYRMTNVSSSHFIGRRCTDRSSWAGLWTEISLLLDDDYYAIT